MANKKIKLGDYCDITKGNIGITKAIPGEFPLVVTAEKRLSHNEFQFDCKAVIVPLVSSTGHGHASLKRVHYQEGKFSIGTILCALVVKDETIINPRFLYIYLSYFKDHLLVPLMKGAANVTLSISKIKTVEIILPSLERQLEIIELEKNNILADELNTEIETQKNLLSQLKQSILQEAIQGKLTADWRARHPELVSGSHAASELLKRIKAEKAQLIKGKKIKKEKALPFITKEEIPFDLPEGWVWCRLGVIIVNAENIDIQKNLSPNEIINYVDIDAIDNKKQVIREAKELPVRELSSRARRVLKKGNIMYSLVRPYLHNLAIIEDDKKNYIGSTGFAVFNCLLIENKYIFWLLLSKYIENIYLDFMDGFNSPSITHDQFKNTIIPIPPIEEQKEIVKKVELLMAHCQQLEQEITKSEANAQMLMQAVLKEAFSNKG